MSLNHLNPPNSGESRWTCQLLCWKDTRRGPVASENCYLRNGPFWRMEVFPSLEGSFSCSGACLRFWPHLKRKAGNHEAGRLWLGKKGQRSRMALICYRSLITHMSKLGSCQVLLSWLTDSSPSSPARHCGIFYFLFFLGIKSVVLSPIPESLSLRKNNNNNIM